MDQELPSKIGERAKTVLPIAHEFCKPTGHFQIQQVVDRLHENPTEKQKKNIHNAINLAKMKGWLERSSLGRWKFTPLGERVMAAINDLPLRKSPAPAAPRKKKIKDIEPLPSVFEPNLSRSATHLAEGLGAVLDENQSYRDFLKQQLHALADFLDAKIIYPHEEKQNGSTTITK